MKRALLFSGGIERRQAKQRYRNNLSAMYRYLLQAGYEKQNIRVCLEDGPTVDFEETRALVCRPATRAQLKHELAWLAQTSEGDQIFFFATNHGHQDGLYPWGTGPLIKPQDIESSLSACAAKKVLLFAQCYSGVFTGMKLQRAVTLCACGSVQRSYAKPNPGAEPLFDNFVYQIVGVLCGVYPDGVPLPGNAPSANPTLAEVYRFALRNAGLLETPDCWDPENLASTLCL